MERDSMARLLQVMRALRDPDRGCPWDLKQDFRSIAPHTVEEAHEVVEAIESGDLLALKHELGDLLFQVVFHARMAEERGLFDFDEVATAIADKLERRHPHVFAGADVADADAQTDAWERQKAEERAARGETGTLDGVARGLPALIRAVKLSDRAARVGFDWPGLDGVLEKVEEERAELAEAILSANHGAIDHEVGDLLLAVSNLARHLGVDPEGALRRANRRFEDRFREMERLIALSGQRPEQLGLDLLEAAWQEAKKTTG